jgi:ribosomal-protein-alanine acetyltransferase
VSWKHFLFRLLGKDPDAVVVSFLSGPRDLALRMLAEIRTLVPDRAHYAVYEGDPPPAVDGVEFIALDRLPELLKRKRIGLAPVLFIADNDSTRMRRAAFRHSPTKILAYNERLERHHLRLRNLVASWLFVRGVPLDRIFLRPSWLYPFKRDRSSLPDRYDEYEGRPLTPGRPRVAIVTPYFPYPLSHGGAVRIFHLLREASRDFDVFLFSFGGKLDPSAVLPVQELCARIIVLPNPRYREPRWSTLLPPEVREFDVPLMHRLIRDLTLRHSIELRQVEYTQMAVYGADVLVEHDVTFDLYKQVWDAERTRSAWWNWWRWSRFETSAVSKFPRVVVMSEKDAHALSTEHAVVIPNGVDLERFRPEPEADGARVLFVGSFRHFPNIVAYRFLVEEIWPVIRAAIPDASLTVVAGPDPHLYYSPTQVPEGVQLLSFVQDVRPLYSETNLVVVPTRVSAGTNLKVLEAMAMSRAVLSTSSGCGGIGLSHGESVWIADTAEDFANSAIRLLRDSALRSQLASHARILAERQFDWRRLGELQRQLWYGLLRGEPIRVRTGVVSDLEAIERIQAQAHAAAQWDTSSYLLYELKVVERAGSIIGFMVTRVTDVDEVEILNIAIDPAFQRHGAATSLIRSIESSEIFLEVRESNQRAISLYRKLGFEVTGQRKDYYEEPVENAIVMRLSRKLNHVNV